MNKILLIEDDEAIALIEKDYLEINECQVTICQDGVSGIEEALKGDYDLIILDLMLPGMDGFSVCKKLREHLDIPIIMVTARLDQCDQIRGLGLGADDYIMKPFEPSILVARVKSNLAQYRRGHQAQTQTSVIIKGPFKIHLDTHRAYLNEKEIELKNKEFAMLLLFMKNADMVLSKEQLYQQIWGADSYGETATVAVHINRLRDKLQVLDPQHTYIQTIWGVGYRFTIS